MALFDVEVARDKSLHRFERAIRTGCDGRKAESAWWVDHVSITNIATIVEWCNGKGIKIQFEKCNNAVFNKDIMTISIAASIRPLRQVFYLLHECGHYMISNTAGKDDRFKMGYRLGEGFTSELSFSHKLACVEEEFEAWHRGWRLSQRLKMNLDRKQFDAVRRSCLKTYLVWVTKYGK